MGASEKRCLARKFIVSEILKDSDHLLLLSLQFDIGSIHFNGKLYRGNLPNQFLPFISRSGAYEEMRSFLLGNDALIVEDLVE